MAGSAPASSQPGRSFPSTSPGAELKPAGGILAVLLVEDVREISDMYKLALGMQGHRVRVVENGLMVEAEVALNRPDIIVLDIELPGRNGLDVLRGLKRHPISAGIPVLVLSNSTSPETACAALDLGALGLAVKSETTPGRLGQMLVAYAATRHSAAPAA